MELNQQTDDEFMKALNEALESDPSSSRPAPAPAEKPQIMSISHVHEAIMNWMIANPHLPLKACAGHFGYTRAWLSTIIHSDLFQARLREKQEEVFSGIKEDLNTKLGALADVGIERLQEKLEHTDDTKTILETTKLALASLGFGAKPGGGAANVQNNTQVNNVYVASSADLEAAREQMRRVGTVSSQQLALCAPTDATPLPLEANPLEGMRQLAHRVMGPPDGGDA